MTDQAQLATKVQRKQREQARKQQGSVRHRRVGGQLTKLKRKQKNIRANDTNHISRELADKTHTVVVKDLNTAAMTKSAKGTQEEPGQNVKAKSGLNRVILGSNWYQLYLCLLYKCAALVQVDPKHTSQMCHQCGCIDKRNRKSQTVFHCVGVRPPYARRPQCGDQHPDTLSAYSGPRDRGHCTASSVLRGDCPDP